VKNSRDSLPIHYAIRADGTSALAAPGAKAACRSPGTAHGRDVDGACKITMPSRKVPGTWPDRLLDLAAGLIRVENVGHT
jgi:hypothetical protein